ncbi:hypothetical protein M3649_04060 [Ureibacillus chungkukjangi]|uniref:hypothetical protein n=1 Tax=Ureibacillus chungkukjangi TaxID=1202712 RepID=UPI00203C6C2C|nr:hypothetical protein [Ureibacillus chungkukjangi]MCM3387307.1 hypothetical protein [Ureibacillus chungkukjangi]
MNYEDLSNFYPKLRKEVIDDTTNIAKIDGQLYNYDTGENITDRYNVDVSLKKKAATKKQIESFQSKESLKEHEKMNGGFVFLFYQMSKQINETIPDLKKPDIARLLYLFTFISWEENVLTYRNGKEISKKELPKLLKLSSRRCNELCERLIENKVIHIDDKTNNIYINESLAIRGVVDIKELKKENITYTRLFRKTVQTLFESTNAKELGRLSILYLILPYLNLATNIVSHNPYETDIDKIEPMKLNELSELLGYTDYSKLKTLMNHIKIGDEVAFAFVELESDRRTKRIIVNPNIVFAGDYEQLKLIRVFFK